MDLFTQSLSLLLRWPSYLIGYKARLDGVPVEPQLHKHAPHLYDLAKMFNQDVPVPSGLSVPLSGDFWRVLENIISAYRQNQDSVGNRLTLALSWFKKGSDELEPSDRLVAFWISFNALYANPSLKDRESIKNYSRENIDSVLARHYVIYNETRLKDLSGFPINSKNKKPVAKELNELLSVNQIDYTAVAKESVLVIYGIRNNLFHGDYDLASIDAQKPVATAEALLSFLVRALLVKEMTGKLFIIPNVPHSLAIWQRL